MITTAKQQHPLLVNMKKHWLLYLMILPGISFFIVFKYIPLFGSVIAFTDVKISNVWASTWVGFDNFKRLFGYSDFLKILENTAVISLYLILFTFPIPIVLSVFMNELHNARMRRAIQSIFCFPYFLSWVIVAGIAFNILSLDGVVNTVRGIFGLSEPVLFMQKEKYFRPIITLSAIWRNSGWDTIIYMAAIVGIDPKLYESAKIDGAGRFRQMLSITFPSLSETIIVLFLLKVGNFLQLGFDHIYSFLTPMTQSVGDIIDTYVFRVSILGGSQYGYTTAIGLFQSLIGLVLVISLDKVSRKLTDRGLF